MRCVICSRPLMRPAVTIGKSHIGPDCAKKIGALAPKPRFRLSVAVPEPEQVDPRQMALSLEVA